jgi:hypothetical protein
MRGSGSGSDIARNYHRYYGMVNESGTAHGRRSHAVIHIDFALRQRGPMMRAVCHCPPLAARRTP